MALSVGKAQGLVLNALGIYASDNHEAGDFFTLLGLRVTSKRAGRDSLPVITVAARGRREERGGWSGADNEEGDTWMETLGAGLPIFDMTPLMPWVTNPDEAERITALADGRPAPTRAELLARKRELPELWRAGGGC